VFRLRRLSADDLAFFAVWCALTVVALVPVWHQRMLPMLTLSLGLLTE